MECSESAIPASLIILPLVPQKRQLSPELLSQPRLLLRWNIGHLQTSSYKYMLAYWIYIPTLLSSFTFNFVMFRLRPIEVMDPSAG